MHKDFCRSSTSRSALVLRDPIVRLTRNLFASRVKGVSVAQLAAHAKDCVEAASLIPKPKVYDDFRMQCLGVAAILASTGRSQERTNHVQTSGSTDIGHLAVRLWRQAREYDPTDASGELRVGLSYALADNCELAEAWTVAKEVPASWRESPDFLYNAACITSRLGDLDNSLLLFKETIRCGYLDIAHAKTDPDLQQLRENRQQQFAGLTTIKVTCGIVYGFLNDDITLANGSSFPLTDVTLQVCSGARPAKMGSRPKKGSHHAR